MFAETAQFYWMWVKYTDNDKDTAKIKTASNSSVQEPAKQKHLRLQHILLTAVTFIKYISCFMEIRSPHKVLYILNWVKTL